jgi:hypothetical protein
VYALQAALDGAIKRDYQKVLARWGEQGEAVALGGQPAWDNLLMVLYT